MVIAHGINARLQVIDIETLAEVCDIGCYNPDTREWTEFEISEFKNDLYSFVKWYTSKPCDYAVTFNGIGFDQQVLQHVVDQNQKWYDLSGKQVAAQIYKFTQELIESQNYSIPLPYREDQFALPALDLFRIHHFDNEAKRTSLKWCAFMMDMDVEEMPIHHGDRGLTREQIDTVIAYRRNDCFVTTGLLYLTLGEIERIRELCPHASLDAIKDYKGKNKIQDRMDVQRTTGLHCLNWSDVKIGEEWNKLDYKLAEGVKDDRNLLPTKVKQPYGQKFSKFFPSTVSFTTEKLKSFYDTIGDTKVRAARKGEHKQEFPVTVGNTTYTIAHGGIHSTESYRRVITPQGWLTRDADVGSQYPWFIAKQKVYAPHLTESMIKLFTSKIDKRIEYKKKASELEKAGDLANARLYKSVQDMLKLCLNGGYYGKLSQNGSFLQYPEGTFRVTIGCQMEILMLIEMLETAGIQVISANTDGIVSHFPQEKEELYNNICSEWERRVGNTTLGRLEYADFDALWQEGINSYIGKKTDGKAKKKGRFMTEFEMNKNKSMRIVPLALEAYFIYGKDPVEFVTAHENIFDFCIAKKASGQLHYEEILGEKDGAEVVRKHKKLIRYYIAKEGNVFMKRGFTNEGAKLNNYCEAPSKSFHWLGEPKLCYFNKYFASPDYGIDHKWYILEVLERIDKIEKTKKAKAFAEQFKPTQQATLF